MRADPAAAQLHFMEADSARAGALTLPTLLVFLKKMVPGMNKRAQRLVRPAESQVGAQVVTE